MEQDRNNETEQEQQIVQQEEQTPVVEDKKSNENEPKLSKGQKIRNALIEFAVYIAVIVLCVTFIPRYVIQRTIVDGDSMEKTLQDQDNLLVEKVSYRFSDPKRFDVVVFYPFGRDKEDYYIKRIIGLPGETIQIVGNTIYINGKAIEEHYGKDPMTESGIATEPLKLAKNEYFVLGDNRKISEDSRYPEIGPVTRDKIEGKAVLRMYPFSEFGTVK